MRLALKLAIVRSGKTQRRIAAETGITENRLSEIVCGWTSPHHHERVRLSEVIGQVHGDLFIGEPPDAPKD